MITPSRRVGLTNGCFDLFHEGHKRFLWEAKKHCYYLIVAVNDDASVRSLKGQHRPFDRLGWRMDQVTAYADMVLPFDGNMESLLRQLPVHLIIRGWDQRTDDTCRVPYVVLPRFGDVSTTGVAYGCKQDNTRLLDADRIRPVDSTVPPSCMGAVRVDNQPLRQVATPDQPVEMEVAEHDIWKP